MVSPLLTPAPTILLERVTVLVLWFTDNTDVPAGIGAVQEWVQLVSAMLVPGITSAGTEPLKDIVLAPAKAAWAVSEARVPPLPAPPSLSTMITFWQVCVAQIPVSSLARSAFWAALIAPAKYVPSPPGAYSPAQAPQVDETPFWLTDILA